MILGTDHLNAPTRAFQSGNAAAWSVSYEPFGNVSPNDDATSYSPTPAIALRRPGHNPLGRTDPTGLWDAFFLCGATASTDTLVRPAVETIGLAGYDSDDGFYLGALGAKGFEVGTHDNYVGYFTGTEVTTSSDPEAISIREFSVGPEIPYVGGFGGGAGDFDTATSHGVFFHITGGVFGQYLSFGVGYAP